MQFRKLSLGLILSIFISTSLMGCGDDEKGKKKPHGHSHSSVVHQAVSNIT